MVSGKGLSALLRRSEKREGIPDRHLRANPFHPPLLASANSLSPQNGGYGLAIRYREMHLKFEPGNALAL